jgi:hypothetical protein
MTEALADRVIERHRKRLHGRARRITIDMETLRDKAGAICHNAFPSDCGTIGGMAGINR